MQVNRRILYTSALSTGSTGPVFGSGVGDSQSFLIWGSVARAYSLAVAATGTRKAFRVVDSGGLNPQDILVLTTGFTDVATLNTWIGTHGTASVTTLYDQVGTNDWTQATVAKMPTITVNGINGMPSMNFVTANSQTLITGSNIASTPVPYTFEAVFQANVSGGGQIASDKTVDIEFFGGSNLAGVYAGGAGSAQDTATDGVPHVIQATPNTGTTGTANVDGRSQVTGTATTGTNSFNGAQLMCIGSYQDSVQYFGGMISEVGMYATSYNSSVQTNARTAYGL